MFYEQIHEYLLRGSRAHGPVASVGPMSLRVMGKSPSLWLPWRCPVCCPAPSARSSPWDEGLQAVPPKQEQTAGLSGYIRSQTGKRFCSENRK